MRETCRRYASQQTRIHNRTQQQRYNNVAAAAAAATAVVTASNCTWCQATVASSSTPHRGGKLPSCNQINHSNQSLLSLPSLHHPMHHCMSILTSSREQQTAEIKTSQHNSHPNSIASCSREVVQQAEWPASACSMQLQQRATGYQH